jgi:DNA-binding MarR family transcriptional regulator
MSGAGPELAVVQDEEPTAYRVDRQIGFILRKANQRHVAIFAARIADLTPPQFAALSKLSDVGDTSQNQLGALVAMDAATIKGVIDRRKARGLVEVTKHDADKRRLMVRLTDEGRAMVADLVPFAEKISVETLAPLTPRERETLLKLLARIA